MYLNKNNIKGRKNLSSNFVDFKLSQLVHIYLNKSIISECFIKNYNKFQGTM